MEKVSSSTKTNKTATPENKETRSESKKTDDSFDKLLQHKDEADLLRGSLKEEKKGILFELLEKSEIEDLKKKEQDEELEGFVIPRNISDKGGAMSPVSGIEEGSKIKLDENLINKIVESTQIIKKGDTTSMEIMIKSSVFDDLKLVITQEGGGIKTEFLTDNQNLKELIKNSVPDLERNLMNRGLEVLNIIVSDINPESKSQDQYDEYRRQNDRQ